ncbi:MAG TPA: Ig-like domain-containing protein [Terriglobales bacterium]|nr:Ig-like domain-containing protein [Terriglobales bacterium]
MRLRPFALCLIGFFLVFSYGCGGNVSNQPTASVATSATLSPSSASVVQGKTQQFAATVKDQFGATIAGASVSWSSSNTNVATVSSSGLATGVAPGTATITATDGAASAGASLTVTAPPIASVTVSPSGSTTIETGATQTFTATAKDANGNAVTGATFTWTSSNTAAATITSAGVATGVAAGSTNITASTAGITSSAVAVSVIQSGSVSGVAASGSPLAGLTVTMKDTTGASRTAVTSATGAFTLDSSGLTPPFILTVQPATGSPLFSVSADSNLTTTINLDPITDMIARSVYSAQGLTVTNAFASPASVGLPTAAQVQLVGHLYQTVFQLWLNKDGVATPATFNFISTPFTANGAGLDQVLDQTKINSTTGAIAVTDGTTTQNSTVTFTPASDTVTVNTSTTSGGTTSVSTASTGVPATSAQAAALAAIQTALANFAQVINTKGAQLADVDLEPFMTTGLQFEALNRAQFAAKLAGLARGQATTLQATALNSLDASGGSAQVSLVFTFGTTTFFTNMNFQLVGGAWQIAGDGRLANVSEDSTMFTSQRGATTQSSDQIFVDVKAPTGTVAASPIVNSPGLLNNVTLSPANPIAETFQATPTSTVQVTLDHWNLSAVNTTTVVPAGTAFTFTLTASGTPVTYTDFSNAFTTDAVAFTGISSGALSGVTLGAQNTFTWNLPRTYALASLELRADVYDGDPNSPSTTQCRGTAGSDLFLPLTTATAAVLVPTTCNGKPTAAVDIFLLIQGINGEESEADAFFSNFTSSPFQILLNHAPRPKLQF